MNKVTKDNIKDIIREPLSLKKRQDRLCELGLKEIIKGDLK